MFNCLESTCAKSLSWHQRSFYTLSAINMNQGPRPGQSLKTDQISRVERHITLSFVCIDKNYLSRPQLVHKRPCNDDNDDESNAKDDKRRQWRRKKRRTLQRPLEIRRQQRRPRCSIDNSDVIRDFNEKIGNASYSTNHITGKFLMSATATTTTIKQKSVTEGYDGDQSD